MSITNVIYTLSCTNVSGNDLTFNLDSEIHFSSGTYVINSFTVTDQTNYPYLTPKVVINIDSQSGVSNPVNGNHQFDITTDDVNQAIFIDIAIEENSTQVHSVEEHRETYQSYSEGGGERPGSAGVFSKMKLD